MRLFGAAQQPSVRGTGHGRVRRGGPTRDRRRLSRETSKHGKGAGRCSDRGALSPEVSPAVWLATQNHSTLVTETTVVPFLPVNPEYSSTRNQARRLSEKHSQTLDSPIDPPPQLTDLGFVTQGRQKLARFNAHEFATLVIDILSDAKRRQQGNSIGSPKGQQLRGKLPYVTFFKTDSLRRTDMSQTFCSVRHQTMWISC